MEESNKEIKEEENKINKKYIIIPIILLCILIIVGIITTIIIKQNDKSYKIEEITTFSYFKLYENEKYGVIDAKGNILVEPKYDNIDIPNPSKPIFVGYFNYDSQKGEYQTEVVNEKNEKILTQYEKVLPLMFKETTTEVPYEKSVLTYIENNKYGIINFEGKKITDAIYDSIESLLYKEGCLIVTQDGKYGVITIEGKEMIKIEYDSITADGYYEEETKYQKAGFVIGQKKDVGYRYGYISNKGKIILDVEYNEINRVTEIDSENEIYLLAFKNGQAGLYKNSEQILKHGYEEIEYNKSNEIFIVQKLSKQGITNKQGKEIIPIEYNYIMISGNKINAQKEEKLYIFDIQGKQEETSDNLTILSTENENYSIIMDENDRFGVIDKDGNTIIESQYQYIEYYFENYFIVTKDGKTGIIDSNNNQKVDFKYDTIQVIENTKVLQAIISSSDTIELYNTKIEKISSTKSGNISVENDYIKVLSEKERNYFDKNGNVLNNTAIFTESSLFAFSKDEKWGFADKDGNIKVEPNYDMVTELNKYGFAGIKKDEKWGVINSEGTVIVEPLYSIEWNEPDFIGQYLKLNFGYGLVYYTKQIQ